MITPADEARFWAKVVKTDGCWLWTGSTSSDGYGRFWWRKAVIRAHRFSWLLTGKPIPDGHDIDHVAEAGCTSRNCIRPSHLEPVTHRVNMMRSTSFVASKAAQTHCIHGHEFTLTNTSIRTNGTRACRTCRSLRERARRAQAKEAA